MAKISISKSMAIESTTLKWVQANRCCWFRDLSENFHIIAVDYVGAGASDKPSSGFHYTIDEQADLIAGMIRELGLGSVNLKRSEFAFRLGLLYYAICCKRSTNDPKTGILSD